MATCCIALRRIVAVFFEYDTPKIVHIRSKSIGILNRIVQFCIVAYIIGWVMVYQRGYQMRDIGVSGTTTKVKGVAYTNVTDSRVGVRVWDTADIVVPAEENGAFFVMTNMIITQGQAQGECAEATSVDDSHCETDADCLPVGKAYLLGHGVTTGLCNSTTGTCMVRAWCPIEADQLPVNYSVLNATKDFTVLIKNHVYFPLYKKSRSNILEAENKTYLQKCTYNINTDPFCPVFRLGYIVGQAIANTPNQSYDQLAIEGAVISIRISWNCDFDYNVKQCTPRYDFDRLDQDEDSLIARGYNFRYSNNYFENSVEKRQLIKSYGILFIITVDAKAGAFNIVPTLQNVGSGLALLGVAVVLCDIFVLYVHKRKQFFQEHKYEQVKTSDAYEFMESGND